jgi:hypothetical protein
MKAVKKPSFSSKYYIRHMKKSYKALLYNFLGFAPIFLILYYVILEFTGLIGLWVPLTSFVVTTIISPKFQAIKYMGEEKIFMKWLFIKGIKEVK